MIHIWLHRKHTVIGCHTTELQISTVGTDTISSIGIEFSIHTVINKSTVWCEFNISIKHPELKQQLFKIEL